MGSPELEACTEAAETLGWGPEPKLPRSPTRAAPHTESTGPEVLEGSNLNSAHANLSTLDYVAAGLASAHAA